MFIILGLFLIPGILLWITALVLLLKARAGGRGGVDVQGEVYEHRSYISHGRQMHYPRFRAVVNGQTITCEGTTATSWKRPPIGTPVKLVHVASDPETPLRERGVPTGALIAAISCMVCGAGLLTVGTLALVSTPTTPDRADVSSPSRDAHPRGPKRSRHP